MNVNMERVTLAMEIATINLAVSIVCVMLVVVEMRQFKEDAGKTSYHRLYVPIAGKHDWQLVHIYSNSMLPHLDLLDLCLSISVSKHFANHVSLFP